MNLNFMKLKLHSKGFLNIIRIAQYMTSDASATVAFPKPNIPIRIKRKSTDILKALATTIQQDPTGPAYKFHDDPYLYPFSIYEKKVYALAKESGRKAARWVRDSHPDLFNHNPDDPVIKKFIPKITYDENSEITEEELVNSVKKFYVSEAIDLYRISQTKNIVLQEETLYSLLELVCYYNCEDPIDTDWTEEMRSQLISQTQRLIKTWKDAGLAEELFSSLKDKGSRAYCAIIKGMSKYGQVDNAWKMYQEVQANNLCVDTDTINSLIRIAPALKEENELRWNLIQELLQKIVELNLRPNLGTMNALLESLSMMRNWMKARGLALQTLAEFKQIGIEPSLATHYFLIKIFYTLRHSKNMLLPSILNEIEGKDLAIQHPKDTWFFSAAMQTCNRDLESFEVAQRLNNLLMVGNNFKFLGESAREMYYYRDYFTLAINSLPLQDFMKIYEGYVPNLYSPDKGVMEEIVKNIGVHDDISLLPRIWSDCIMLETANIEKMMEMVLMVMSKHALEAVDPKLGSQLISIACDIWDRIQNQDKQRRNKIEWSGQMLGDCISTLLRCGDNNKPAEIMSAVDNDPSMVIGVIPIDILQTLFDALLDNGFRREAQAVVKYAKFNDFSEANAMAKQLTNHAMAKQLTNQENSAS